MNDNGYVQQLWQTQNPANHKAGSMVGWVIAAVAVLGALAYMAAGYFG